MKEFKILQKRCRNSLLLYLPGEILEYNRYKFFKTCNKGECYWCTKGNRLYNGGIFNDSNIGCSQKCNWLINIELYHQNHPEFYDTRISPDLNGHRLEQMILLNNYILTNKFTNFYEDNQQSYIEGWWINFIIHDKLLEQLLLKLESKNLYWKISKDLYIKDEEKDYYIKCKRSGFSTVHLQDNNILRETLYDVLLSALELSEMKLWSLDEINE